MKLRIVAACFAVLLTSPAFAQDGAPERWTDQSGQISLALGANGWEMRDRAVFADVYNERTLIVAGPVGAAPGAAMCALQMLSAGAYPAMQRSQINASTRAMEGAPSVRESVEKPNFRLNRIETVDVGEVAVMGVYGWFLDLETISRKFFLQPQQELLMYDLICSVDASDVEGAAQMQAVAASLAIADAGAQE